MNGYRCPLIRWSIVTTLVYRQNECSVCNNGATTRSEYLLDHMFRSCERSNSVTESEAGDMAALLRICHLLLDLTIKEKENTLRWIKKSV